ncbi:MAG: prepilin peptidase [Armatimonadetes bacterium]|nr:prepilin peptidase [Armatimonadota bacterium]
MPQLVQWMVALVASGVAAVTDLRAGKVYNWLTVPTLLVGLALHTAASGLSGALFALEGLAVAIALLVGIGLMGRLIGGGDAKLLLALGAVLGPVALLQSFAAGAIIGGVVALLTALHHRRLKAELAGLGRSVAVRVWGRCPMDAYTSASVRLPYAVALALGVALACVYNVGGVKAW